MSKFIPVAKVNEIPPGEARAFDVEGKPVGIFNVDGHFYAIHNHCTHEDAPLHEGEVLDGRVICPWHQAEFNLETGEAECLPGVGCLKTYPLRISGEDLLIEV